MVGYFSYLDVPSEVTKRLGSVGYNPNESPIYKEVINNPLILTIDPNFQQRDIQVYMLPSPEISILQVQQAAIRCGSGH